MARAIPNITNVPGVPTIGRARRARIITAVIRPALGPLVDGDAIEAALSADIGETSNYASTEGSITSVTVTATVNGNAANVSDTVLGDDLVVVTVTVQDDASNERVFTLSRTVELAELSVFEDGVYEEGVFF